ncbi:MAG: ATP-dependent DNA helicase [Treponema sp.]|nr:ATP-dependent DNA helicase [Treponema sp.]
MEEREVKVYQKIDSEESSFYISEGGALSKISENFEERKSQIELLKHITKSFNENKIGVFEAGTGVGKSFAYLIPSILWASKNHEKVVISTGTINLQGQLCQKDIPIVEKILGRKVKYILMKGRQNYICKRRLQDVNLIPDLFDEDSELLKRISDWAETSETGSKSDLPFMPSENTWSKVNSESDACMGNRCPYFDQCFVMKIRKEAANCDLIVVNHHLLFADIEARMSGGGYENAIVLPPYNRIVFDEAHGVEAAATSFFSESMSRFKLIKLVGQLYRRRKTAESGHLINVAIISSNEEKMSNAYELSDKIKNDILTLEQVSLDLLSSDFNMRLCTQSAKVFGPVLSCLDELSKSLGNFVGLVNSILDGVSEEDRDTPSFWETRMISRRLEGYLKLMRDFSVWDEHPDHVFWIQKKRLSDSLARDVNPWFVTFTSTPLNISYLMNEGVYDPMKTVIFTSATLRTGNNYNYWMNRSGVNLVEKERICTENFDSPFPYHKNMLFLVPSDAPFSHLGEFQQYIEIALPRLITAAGGRTLVLFTSYDSLKSAYNSVFSQLRDFSGSILKQGDMDNAVLLKKFKEERESVLFATDSFWQGVDVPGDSLSQVIIVKLPFSVPNDPVFMARSEEIEKKGGSSFMEMSVPEAVIKFRQGVGRLIRKGNDRGTVVVLDKRLYEKQYGRIFLSSLPECKMKYEPFMDIVSSIKSFLDND